MGFGITNNKTEALANSGDMYAKNYFFNGGDARLVANVTDTDAAQLLANVNALRVVEHAPSENLCKHEGRDPAACAKDRTVGLVAQEVSTVVPAAVGSGTSLSLRDTAKIGNLGEAMRNHTPPPVLEEVKEVQSLDVRVLLAQLVGSVQALSKQNRAQAAEIRALQEALRRQQ